MAVANTITQAYDRLFSTTLSKMRPGLAFEISRANVLLAHIYRGKALRYDTGADVKISAAIQKTPNVFNVPMHGSFSVAPSDGPDTARFNNWTRIIGAMLLDNMEVAQNSGPEQFVNLVTAKRAEVYQGICDDISRQLYQNTGTSAAPTKANATDMDGLITGGFFEFQAKASQTQSPGGIPAATYSNWRNEYFGMTKFSDDGLDTWDKTEVACSLSGTRNDLITCDPDLYRWFGRLTNPNQAEKDPQLFDFGFQNLKFKGIPVVPEPELAGTGRTFFFTTTGRMTSNYLNLTPQDFKHPGKNKAAQNMGFGTGIQLSVLKGFDFEVDGPLPIPNSDQRQWLIKWAAQIICSSKKRLGCTDFGAGSVVY